MWWIFFKVFLFYLLRTVVLTSESVVHEHSGQNSPTVMLREQTQRQLWMKTRGDRAFQTVAFPLFTYFTYLLFQCLKRPDVSYACFPNILTGCPLVQALCKATSPKRELPHLALFFQIWSISSLCRLSIFILFWAVMMEWKRFLYFIRTLRSTNIIPKTCSVAWLLILDLLPVSHNWNLWTASEASCSIQCGCMFTGQFPVIMGQKAKSQRFKNTSLSWEEAARWPESSLLPVYNRRTPPDSLRLSKISTQVRSRLPRRTAEN